MVSGAGCEDEGIFSKMTETYYVRGRSWIDEKEKGHDRARDLKAK